MQDWSEKKKVNVIITIIIEYAWICLKRDAEYASGPKYAKIWQSSEYGRVLNMRALHSILNMPEYAEFWIYLRF